MCPTDPHPRAVGVAGVAGCREVAVQVLLVLRLAAAAAAPPAAGALAGLVAAPPQDLLSVVAVSLKKTRDWSGP